MAPTPDHNAHHCVRYCSLTHQLAFLKAREGPTHPDPTYNASNPSARKGHTTLHWPCHTRHTHRFNINRPSRSQLSRNGPTAPYPQIPPKMYRLCSRVKDTQANAHRATGATPTDRYKPSKQGRSSVFTGGTTVLHQLDPNLHAQ